MFDCSQIKDTKLQKYKLSVSDSRSANDREISTWCRQRDESHSLFFKDADKRRSQDSWTVCATKENSRKIRGTSPLVFLSKMLIRGSPSILGHSVCNKRKLKKDLQLSYSNKCYMCLPSLVPSLQQQ